MAESVPQLLARLNLGRYAATFAEEEINDVALLTSMGKEMVRGRRERYKLRARTHRSHPLTRVRLRCAASRKPRGA